MVSSRSKLAGGQPTDSAGTFSDPPKLDGLRQMERAFAHDS